MQSSDYLTAWGFPRVFEDVDRLIDTRTRVFRFSPYFVTKGNVHRFDLFWEFERHQRIFRVGFEVRAGRQSENACLLRQPQNDHDDIWGIRRIVLVPFEEDVCDVDYLDKSAKDVLILPGREKMCTDANGVFSLPQIEVARTYSCPGEVIRLELRSREKGVGRDVMCPILARSPMDYDQIKVVTNECAELVPFFDFLKRAKKSKREVRRGMVRKSDIQLEQPVKIVWHDRVVEVQEFTIIDIPGQRVRSVIKVSQVSLILSHMVNNWND